MLKKCKLQNEGCLIIVCFIVALFESIIIAQTGKISRFGDAVLLKTFVPQNILARMGYDIFEKKGFLESLSEEKSFRNQNLYFEAGRLGLNEIKPNNNHMELCIDCVKNVH